jgi:hypothetical protein
MRAAMLLLPGGIASAHAATPPSKPGPKVSQ